MFMAVYDLRFQSSLLQMKTCVFPSFLSVIFSTTSFRLLQMCYYIQAYKTDIHIHIPINFLLYTFINYYAVL